MADTVKKSRIVSDEDQDLEEALLEEFNLRLKNCMSQDDLQIEGDHPKPDNTYENVSPPATALSPKKHIADTQTFLQTEKQENYYDVPKCVDQNGHEEQIYECILEKTEPLDQNYVEMVENKVEHIDLSSKSDHQEYEELGSSASNLYESVELKLPEEPLKVTPTVNLPTTCFTDCSGEKTSQLETELFESFSGDKDSKCSVKDRMLLSCDETSTLLFTQTVTSPMLTPSEENIDFLKGFQRDNTISDSTNSPPKGSPEASEPLEEEKVNFYENTEFYKNTTAENTYENLLLGDKSSGNDPDEGIYEHLEIVRDKPDESTTSKDIYQNIEEISGSDEVLPKQDLKSQDTDEGSLEEFIRTEREVLESEDVVDKVPVTIVEDSLICKNPEADETYTKEKIATETYKKLIYHHKSETNSNYYEKYTEVLSKTDSVSNREKDTETVPAEIVKNLKTQFLNKTESQKNPTTKKEQETKSTHNLIHQIKTRCEGSVEKDKSSFSKFDALQKKNILHVRSSDSTKAQEKFSNGAQIELSTNCKACGKQVFQMEQIKAERALWHKNCFRCTECSKQLTVDTYESNDGTLYCKPHFKALFAPKAVEEDPSPSDKPDLGLEELQSLNVKERFQVFEQYQTQQTKTNELERANVKRSQSILSKLAKFQKHGMDIGVSNEALDGIPIEESESEEEEEEEEIPEGEDPDLVRAKRVQKEKPFHFTGMSDVKKRWEQGDHAREERREETKQEIQNIRTKLFMGKQEKMKEAYQQAVMESESSSNLRKNVSEKIEVCDTKSIKERFEKGEVANERLDRDSRNEEEEVYESEISKKSRSMFLELDASASKPPQVSPVTPTKLDVKKARETETPDREIYRDPDVVRAEEYIDDSHVAKESHTASKMLNKFRQMEENMTRTPENLGPKPLKCFTPPPEPAKPEERSDDEESSEYEEEEEEVDQSGKLPEDLIEAQKAARAKQLRAKFEKWEASEIKREQQNSVNVIEEFGEEQSQIESTRVLRAKFEQMRDSSSEGPKSPRVKPNRFVEISTTITENCQSCSERVYPLEKLSIHGNIYHKSCFKCMECSCILRMDSYSYNQGLLYCTPHFKRLFISKGNYDSAFGLDAHKEKWQNSVNNMSMA